MADHKLTKYAATSLDMCRRTFSRQPATTVAARIATALPVSAHRGTVIEPVRNRLGQRPRVGIPSSRYFTA